MSLQTLAQHPADAVLKHDIWGGGPGTQQAEFDKNTEQAWALITSYVAQSGWGIPDTVPAKVFVLMDPLTLYFGALQRRPEVLNAVPSIEGGYDRVIAILKDIAAARASALAYGFVLATSSELESASAGGYFNSDDPVFKNRL